MLSNCNLPSKINQSRYKINKQNPKVLLNISIILLLYHKGQTLFIVYYLNVQLQGTKSSAKRLSQGQMYPGPNSPAKLMFRRSKKKVPFCTQLLKWICKKRKRRVSKTNEHFCFSQKEKKIPTKKCDFVFK